MATTTTGAVDEAAMTRTELRAWLAEHEMTADQLAEALEVHPTTVRRYLATAPGTEATAPVGLRPISRAVRLALDAVAAGLKPRPAADETLQTWMERNAYDSHELADDLGVHYTAVRKWLKGDAPGGRPLVKATRLALATLAADREAARERRAKRRTEERERRAS